MTTAQAVKASQRAHWILDPSHSEIGFAVKHLMISTVKGRFESFDAQIELDETDPTDGEIRVSIDADSINTRFKQRDDHLRSADFFDAATHPKIEFVSRSIERVSDDHFRVVGDLTIRGVTREVELDAEVAGRSREWGKEIMGVSLTGSVDRRDYGLLWNQAVETGGIAVGNEVSLNIQVELQRSSA
jgi:polyisoprenoid-binding protein YceI